MNSIKNEFKLKIKKFKNFIKLSKIFIKLAISFENSSPEYIKFKGLKSFCDEFVMYL